MLFSAEAGGLPGIFGGGVGVGGFLLVLNRSFGKLHAAEGEVGGKSFVFGFVLQF
jgi:hypothetical protein